MICQTARPSQSANSGPGRTLDIGFWLPRRIESPRFHRIETIYPNAHMHVARITAPEQLDREVAGWLREA